MEYELYHYGISGMKWGIRRYQNKDGSLTAAGKKRLAKEEARQKEVAAERARRVSSDRLSTKKMTSEEIKARKERLQLEKDYNTLKDQTKSKGQAFIERVMTAMAEKSLVNIGTQVINSGLTFITNEALKKTMSGSTLSPEDTERLFNELKIHPNNKKKDK